MYEDPWNHVKARCVAHDEGITLESYIDLGNTAALTDHYGVYLAPLSRDCGNFFVEPEGRGKVDLGRQPE